MPAWASALALASTLAASPEQEPPPLRVTIEGEPGCVSAEDVVAATEARFDDQRWQPVSMQVWIGPAPDGRHEVRYQLESADAVGEGRVVTSDCATAIAVLGIKLGLAAAPRSAVSLDLGPKPAAMPWAPVSAATVEPAAPPTDPERPTPWIRDRARDVAPRPSERPRVWLSVAAGAMNGGLGGWSSRVELGVALEGVPWRLEAYGVHALAPITRIDASRTMRLQAAGAGLRGCAAARWRRLHIPACLGVEAASVRVDVQGLARGGVGNEPWVLALAHTGLGVALTRRLTLWTRAGAGVALLRPAFSVTGRGTIFRSDPTMFTATAGISVAIAGPTTDPRDSVQ